VKSEFSIVRPLRKCGGHCGALSENFTKFFGKQLPVERPACFGLGKALEKQRVAPKSYKNEYEKFAVKFLLLHFNST
jgi:hypothetical protein